MWQSIAGAPKHCAVSSGISTWGFGIERRRRAEAGCHFEHRWHVRVRRKKNRVTMLRRAVKANIKRRSMVNQVIRSPALIVDESSRTRTFAPELVANESSILALSRRNFSRQRIVRTHTIALEFHHRRIPALASSRCSTTRKFAAMSPPRSLLEAGSVRKFLAKYRFGVGRTNPNLMYGLHSRRLRCP